MESVQLGAPSERWAAVQCLAMNEHYEDCVINELITHVNDPDIVKHKKAGDLLKHLSKFTVR